MASPELPEVAICANVRPARVHRSVMGYLFWRQQRNDSSTEASQEQDLSSPTHSHPDTPLSNSPGADYTRRAANTATTSSAASDTRLLPQNVSPLQLPETMNPSRSSHSIASLPTLAEARLPTREAIAQQHSSVHGGTSALTALLISPSSPRGPGGRAPSPRAQDVWLLVPRHHHDWMQRMSEERYFGCASLQKALRDVLVWAYDANDEDIRWMFTQALDDLAADRAAKEKRDAALQEEEAELSAAGTHEHGAADLNEGEMPSVDDTDTDATDAADAAYASDTTDATDEMDVHMSRPRDADEEHTTTLAVEAAEPAILHDTPQSSSRAPSQRNAGDVIAAAIAPTAWSPVNGASAASLGRDMTRAGESSGNSGNGILRRMSSALWRQRTGDDVGHHTFSTSALSSLNRRNTRTEASITRPDPSTLVSVEAKLPRHLHEWLYRVANTYTGEDLSLAFTRLCDVAVGMNVEDDIFNAGDESMKFLSTAELHALVGVNAQRQR